MEQAEFKNIPDTKFSNYLVDLENLRQEDLTNINSLIKKYPYCQALHLLAARSAIGTPFYEKTLANAAVSVPSRNVLYDFIHQPYKFKADRHKKAVIEKVQETEPLISVIEDVPVSDKIEEVTTLQDDSHVHDDEVFEEIASSVTPDELVISIHQQPIPEMVEIENLSLDGEKYSEILITEEDSDEPKLQEQFVEEEIKHETADEEVSAIPSVQEISEEHHHHIDEEEKHGTAFLDQIAEDTEAPNDEIETAEDEHEEEITVVGLESSAGEEADEDILEKEATEETSGGDEQQEHEVQDESLERVTGEDETLTGQQEVSPAINSEAFPYIENIEEDDEEQEGNIAENEERVSAAYPQENLPKVLEPVNVSRYDDERLPYTFLWWLAKTRKTYQENLRPYAAFSLDTTQEIKKNGGDLLEHQIAENIFHINSVNEIENKVEGTSTVAFDFMKKEHQIIEKFINEEPQIKPPPANKIDTENKAKRSSEDSNELVSETLAKVYMEQMLFHKALEVYKKLSLKYPEKSAYFASQIKYLELKVN